MSSVDIRYQVFGLLFRQSVGRHRHSRYTLFCLVMRRANGTGVLLFGANLSFFDPLILFTRERGSSQYLDLELRRGDATRSCPPG